MNSNMMMQEMQTNPLIKLQMSDKNIMQKLLGNPDPKIAEKLIEDKLMSLGLTKQETAIVLLKHGLKYPLQKALMETGLSEEQLNNFYDNGIAKVNNFLGIETSGASVLGGLKTMFNGNANRGEPDK